MARGRESGSAPGESHRPPARTPEGREQQLVRLAVDLAEMQIREGTASAQVITHYLKLGSSREFLEQERIRGELELMAAKREQMEQAKRIEAMYGEALTAMRAYSGQDPLEMEHDEDV